MEGARNRRCAIARTAYPALLVGVLFLLVAAIPALGSGGTSLSFQECLSANGGSCASHENKGLDAADAVAVSPDGKSVYVASNADSGVVIFDRNTTTGALTDAGCISSEAGICETTIAPGMVNAEGVAVSPDGKSVYLTSSSEGSVIHFKRSTETGALTYADCVTSRSSGCESGDEVPGLSGAWGIAVSPDGKSVYVAAYTRNAIVSFARDETTGTLTDGGCLASHDVGCGAGNEAAPGLEGATDVAISPDGKNVYVASGVAGSGVGSISTFERSSAGALTYGGCVAYDNSKCAETGNTALNGASGVAVSPDGKSVYVAAETSNAISSFDRSGGSGALTYEGCLTSEATGCVSTGIVGLKGAFGDTVSPDGTSVYVVSLEHDNALVRLERDTGSGALSIGECFTSNPTVTTACGTSHAGLAGLTGAERVATSPDGKNVYVAALTYSAVDVFGPASGGSSRSTLTVVKAGTGSGTVTGLPAGIECGATCSHTYPDGTKITLSAAPAGGSSFSGWSGSGCAGTGTCELTIAADITVTATFQASAAEEVNSPPRHSEDGSPPTPVPAPQNKSLKCKKGFKRKVVHGKARCTKHKAHSHKPEH